MESVPDTSFAEPKPKPVQRQQPVSTAFFGAPPPVHNFAGFGQTAPSFGGIPLKKRVKQDDYIPPKTEKPHPRIEKWHFEATITRITE